MEVFLLSIHFIQQTLSYIFHIELVSLKNIEILSNLGKSEFGQKRMPKYGHIFLSSLLSQFLTNLDGNSCTSPKTGLSCESE